MVKKDKKNDPIDFVVLWVDGNDPDWRKEKQKYLKNTKQNIDDAEIRYRDWGILKYWFRGVEQFAPWVNKIHFVTYGHIPEWLNTDNEKLNIVKHEDFIPQKYLPTFNSNAIELMMHKIPGLSEHFVAFNDDMYIIKKTKPEHFFKNKLPVNTMSFLALTPNKIKPYYKTLSNNLEIINKYYDFKKTKKKNILKYLSLKQKKYILTTLPLLLYPDFVGFKNYHIGNSYLKSTLEEVWSKEKEALLKTVSSKFRDYDSNNNHWIFNYWQFAKGNFQQRSSSFGINTSVKNDNAPRIITKQTCHIICLNDEDCVADYHKIRQRLVQSFEKILPEKSSYEK